MLEAQKCFATNSLIKICAFRDFFLLFKISRGGRKGIRGVPLREMSLPRIH